MLRFYSKFKDKHSWTTKSIMEREGGKEGKGRGGGKRTKNFNFWASSSFLVDKLKISLQSSTKQNWDEYKTSEAHCRHNTCICLTLHTVLVIINGFAGN